MISKVKRRTKISCLPGGAFEYVGLFFHRYYEPDTGRYITADPIGLNDGINLYAYVGGNPINAVDPWGLDWVYHQSTGQIYRSVNGKTQPKTTSVGYSGKGKGLNNPSMECKDNVGPIPRGRYTIGKQKNSKKTGVGVLPLIPDPANNMYGRYAFQIHGDNRYKNKSASSGCIILNRKMRDKIANSGDNVLRVVK